MLASSIGQVLLQPRVAELVPGARPDARLRSSVQRLGGWVCDGGGHTVVARAAVALQHGRRRSPQPRVSSGHYRLGRWAQAHPELPPGHRCAGARRLSFGGPMAARSW